MTLHVLVSMTLGDCSWQRSCRPHRTWICHNSRTTLWFCGPCGSFVCFAFCNLADVAPAFHDGAPLAREKHRMVCMVCVFQPVTLSCSTLFHRFGFKTEDSWLWWGLSFLSPWFLVSSLLSSSSFALERVWSRLQRKHATFRCCYGSDGLVEISGYFMRFQRRHPPFPNSHHWRYFEIPRRILRIMHISGELQAIITAVMKGLRSFVWTVIFLLLLLYAVGVFITQSVTDFKISILAEVWRLFRWRLQIRQFIPVWGRPNVCHSVDGDDQAAKRNRHDGLWVNIAASMFPLYFPTKFSLEQPRTNPNLKTYYDISFYIFLIFLPVSFPAVLSIEVWAAVRLWIPSSRTISAPWLGRCWRSSRQWPTARNGARCWTPWCARSLPGWRCRSVSTLPLRSLRCCHWDFWWVGSWRCGKIHRFMADSQDTWVFMAGLGADIGLW